MRVKIRDCVKYLSNYYNEDVKKIIEEFYYADKIDLEDVINFEPNAVIKEKDKNKEYEVLFKVNKDNGYYFIKETRKDVLRKTFYVRAEFVEEIGLRVSDFVKVVDEGHSYPLFEAFFNKYNLNDYYKLHWMYGKDIPNGNYCVKFIGEDCEGNKVCLIENNMCEVYLIGEDGLEKIEIN